jgi:hypothetical protein
MKTSEFWQIISKSERIRWNDRDISVTVTNKLRHIAKERGYDSTHSKKARVFFDNRVFVTEKDGMYLAYKMDKLFKEPFFDSISFHFYEIKTSGGLVYTQPPEANDKRKPAQHICFTAHVFDRFGERVIGETNRKKTIKLFLTEMLVSGFLEDTKKVSAAYENGIGPIAIFTKSGMILGDYKHEKTPDGKDVSIVLYKTFVPFGIARSAQEESRMTELRKIADKVNAGTKLDFVEELYFKNYLNEEIEKQKIGKDTGD